MFQAWAVKMVMMAVSSRPTLLRGNSATITSSKGIRKASTGMLWRMSSRGTSSRSARASFAAQ